MNPTMKEEITAGLFADYYILKDQKLMSHLSFQERTHFAEDFFNNMVKNDLYMYRRDPSRGIPDETVPFSEIKNEQRAMINLASNDYLSFRKRHALIYDSVRATEIFGTGSGSVPMLAGTTSLHRKLEKRLALFTGYPAAISYNSGYAANTGVLTALLGKADMAILDMQVHASIIDGCVNTNKTFFIHNDIESLHSALQKTAQYKNRLVVVDGVYSMDGDIANLPDISDAAHQAGAWVMVDDSHALGVLGKQGRGTVSYFGKPGMADLVTSSLGKALGGAGGFVAGSSELIHLLELTSRTFVFSTSIAPAAAAAVIRSIDLLESGDEALNKLHGNIEWFCRELKEFIPETHQANTGVIPLIITDPYQLIEACCSLYENNIMVVPVFYPVVPKKKSRMRISVTAGLTRAQLAFATETIARTVKPVLAYA